MPSFSYRAYGGRGEFAEGRIEAASLVAANEMLWAQGLTPFHMKPADAGNERWWQREIFGGTRTSPAQLASFTRDFATLNSAEIPLDDALRILAAQAPSRAMRAVIASLLADVLDGSHLSDAMHKHPQVFAVDYVSAVRSGEVGGTLSQVLEEMADLLERRMEIRNRIRSALVYPAILVVFAIVTVGLIVAVLVPGIAPIFAEGGRAMPAFIGLVLTVQAHWTEIAVSLLVMATAATGAFAIALRRPRVRLALDRLKLRPPLFGAFILERETARFARSLGTLLRAGVPLLQASTSARAVIGNRHLGAGVDRALEAVREGSSLHRALERCAALPPVALRMISVGEEAGKLDRMLLRMAAMFEQQTQRTMDRFMTILTPALTLTIAFLVGSLILTVINAILSINELAYR
jgi:general secretion pathway protein F